MRGVTDIVLFEGIMAKDFYIGILKTTLEPFGPRVLPEGCRLMQDNDPKHTSIAVQEHFQQANIVWSKRPPESPDLNPRERKVLHELKHFLQTEHKPKNKQELVEGIVLF